MTKQERREAMPLCTAFIDEMREQFGPPAYIHAQENGQEIEWGTTDIPQARKSMLG